MVTTRTNSTSSRLVEDDSLLDRIRWFLNTVFHQIVTLLTGYTVYILFKYNDYNAKGFLHYILCLLAYVPLMAEGLMLFSQNNVWNLKMKRNTKYYIHGPLLAISAIAVTIGIAIHIQLSNERNSNAKHFKSIHSITGLVSWILTLISVILGLFSFYSVKLRKFVRPVLLKGIHNFFGLSAFVIGTVSLYYGLQKHAFKTFVTETELLVTSIMLFIVTVWASIMAIASLINQMKSIF